MNELVEVHSNPRTQQMRLTDAQARRAFAKPKRKRRSSAVAAHHAALTKAAKGKKKKRRRKKNNPKVMLMEMVIGAAITAAVEIFVIRNKDWQDKIPQQVREFSGAIYALAGFLILQVKVPKMVKGAASGVIAAGVFLQISDLLVKMRKDQAIAEANKWTPLDDLEAEEKKTGVDGLGRMKYAPHRYPQAPNMNAAQAAAALGMQSRVPFHPYGLGVFAPPPRNPGLGVLVDVAAPRDPSLDPRLDPAGLGVLTDSWEASNQLDDQFAFSSSDYRNDDW